MLGVGRSTVREALNGLAMLGAVEVRHGAGAFVSGKPRTGKPGAQTSTDIAAALTKGVTRELLEAREIVEAAIARLAALRRTDADLREIEAVLEGHKRSLTSPAKYAADFHVLLAEAAHNEVLTGVFKSFLKLMVKRGPRLYARLKDFAKWELDQHRAIYEAVRAGDAELAAERMHGHVRAMEAHYRKTGTV
jgi:GntR family transcriptional repressor for pyruvate dehydrogenase complex